MSNEILLQRVLRYFLNFFLILMSCGFILVYFAYEKYYQDPVCKCSGRKLEKNAKFCDKCGEKINQQTQKNVLYFFAPIVIFIVWFMSSVILLMINVDSTVDFFTYFAAITFLLSIIYYLLFLTSFGIEKYLQKQ